MDRFSDVCPAATAESAMCSSCLDALCAVFSPSASLQLTYLPAHRRSFQLATYLSSFNFLLSTHMSLSS